MSWPIERALSGGLIENPRKVEGGYKFNLPGLPTVITIRLEESIADEHVFFVQSHFINTPNQGGAYITSRSYADNSEWALHRAIQGIANYYKEAVDSGLTPDVSWLVQNDDF